MAYLKCLAVPDSLHIHVPCCEIGPLTVHFLFLYICLGKKKRTIISDQDIIRKYLCILDHLKYTDIVDF